MPRTDADSRTLPCRRPDHRSARWGRNFVSGLALGAGILLCGPHAAAAEAGAAPARAEAKAGALDTFRERHDKVISMVRKKASTKKLQAEVDQLLDYDWIAEAALGGPTRYQEACAPRCDEFKERLTQLIRENYLRLIRKAEGHEVEYLDEVRGRKNAWKVATRIQIQRNGRTQNVVVAYVMHEIDGRFQVRDIITDDVSLAKTYRFEFAQLRKRDGVDGIIAQLDDKLAQLAKKE